MGGSILVSAGPIPLHPEVIKAASQPMISHRSALFQKYYSETQEMLGEILHTKNEIFLVPSSGTGCLEASIVSFFSKGDKIVAVDNGLFSGKFIDNCRSFGLTVIVVSERWGDAVNEQRVMKTLSENSDAKAIFMVHNETSTGVLSNIAPILLKIKNKYPPIITIVDAVSSAGGAPLYVDDWNIDVMVTSTQKALMAPPGLGVLVIHSRMWDYCESSDLPKYYFDLRRLRKENQNHMTFTTPSVHTVLGLHRALQLMLEEGMENVYARHLKMKDYARYRARELGFGLVAEDAYASPVVTAITWPDGFNAEVMRATLEKDYFITVAPGLGEFHECGSRIGHMGYISMENLVSVFDVIEKLLNV